MGKFVIQCPNCGINHEASTGIFAKKVLKCQCGYDINVKHDKFVARVCQSCHQPIMYDQSKGTDAKCPICHKPTIVKNTLRNAVELSCPACYCNLTVDKTLHKYVCPLCDTEIDVEKEISKKEVKDTKQASVIKYEGPNDVLIWKHPIEDFNFGSQLIVHESQEAIFFRDGQAFDTFGPGRYTLVTQKVPLLSELYKLPFDQDTFFHSEVYFVNLVTHTNIKWGTDSKIRLFEPTTGLPIEIGASGEFTLRVKNGRKLLLELVGTTNVLKNSDVSVGSSSESSFVKSKFKALIVQNVKTLVPQILKSEGINILEVDSHIAKLSEALRKSINETLDNYGLEIPEFYINNILTPDDDPNFRRMKEQYAAQYLLVREEQIKKDIAKAEQERRVVEAQTLAQEQIIAAQGSAEAYRLQAEAEAREMQMKGYTYQQETQRQVGLAAMENIGSAGGSGAGIASGVLNDVVGLGVTLGAVGSVVGMTKDVITPVTNVMKESVNPTTPEGWACPNCGKANITSVFCPDCGTKKPEPKKGWTCPNCGRIDVTSVFCPDCGTKKPEQAEGWTCPNCGKEKIASVFCPDCGTKRGE